MTFYTNDVCVNRCLHWSLCTGLFIFNGLGNLTEEQEILSTFIDPYALKKYWTQTADTNFRPNHTVKINNNRRMKKRVATKTDNKIIDFHCLPNKKFEMRA